MAGLICGVVFYLSAQGATADISPNFLEQAPQQSAGLLVAQVAQPNIVIQPEAHISTPYRGVLTTLSVDNIQVRSDWEIVGGHVNFTLSVVNGGVALWAISGTEDGFTPPQTITLTVQVTDKFSMLNANYVDLSVQATMTIIIIPSAFVSLSFLAPPRLTVFYGDMGAFITLAIYSGLGHKTYNLTTSSGGEYFGIDPEYGVLSVQGLPAVGIYTLAVDVEDEANAKATIMATVAVEYAPLALDAPPELLATVSVAASLHTFVARGGDLTYTYAIISGNAMGYFALGDDGGLTLTATNAQARSRYTLNVSAMDGRGEAVTVAVSVRVRMTPINMNVEEEGMTLIIKDLHVREEVVALSDDMVSGLAEEGLSLLATNPLAEVELVFDDNLAVSFAVGDVLVLPNPDAEWSYFRVVTELRETGGKIYVKTTQAALDDILEEGSIYLQVAEVSDGSGVGRRQSGLAPAAAVDDYVDCSGYELTGEYSTSGFSACLGAGSNFAISVVKENKKPVGISVSYSAGAKIKAGIGGAASLPLIEHYVATLPYFIAFVIPLGPIPIPVVIPVFVNLKLEAESSDQGDMSAGVGASINIDVNARYDNDWDISGDGVTFGFDSLPPKIHSSDAKLGLAVGPVVLISFFMPPQLVDAGLELQIKANAGLMVNSEKYLNKECDFWKLEMGYKSGVGFKAGVEGYKFLRDLPEFEYSLASAGVALYTKEPICPSFVGDAASGSEGGNIAVGIVLSEEVPEDETFITTLRIDGDVDSADYEIAEVFGEVSCEGKSCELIIPAGQKWMEINIALKEDEQEESEEELILSLDGTKETFVIGISDFSGVCDRTPQVCYEIERQVGKNYAEITEEDLSKIFVMYFFYANITSLNEGDFAGLSSVERLYFGRNELTTLPAGVFEGLSSLESLWLIDNALTTLPAGVFEGLSSLGTLYLSDNALTTLPAGVFEGLSSLQTLWLDGNTLTTLPAGVFEGLSSLEELDLSDHALTTLPAGVFEGLSSLEV